MMLREIRSHGGMLALLDYHWSNARTPFARSQSIKTARDAMRDLSKSLRKRLEV